MYFKLTKHSMLSVHDIRPLYTYTQIDGLVKPCNCRSINWSVDSDFVTSLCEVKMKVLVLALVAL